MPVLVPSQLLTVGGLWEVTESLGLLFILLSIEETELNI